MENQNGLKAKTFLKYSILFICLLSTQLSAQDVNTYLKQGDALFKEQKHQQAEEQYRKALEKEKNNGIALYNLGNTLYQQKRFPEAADAYNKALKNVNDKSLRDKIHYNLGTTYLNNKEAGKSVNHLRHAYEQMPEDKDVAYNLSYALKQLNFEKQQQKKQQQQEKDDKKEEEQQQQQGQQDQEEDKNNQNKPDQEANEQQKRDLSEEELEKLLNIMDEEEQKVQEKLNKSHSKLSKSEKDW